MPLFTDDMIIVYVENPMCSIKNLSELMSSARWQIIRDTLKCQCHLYTLTMNMWKLKLKMPCSESLLWKHSRRYARGNSAFRKVIKDPSEDVHYSPGLEHSTVSPKLIYRFNTIPTKTSARFVCLFFKHNKLILKLIWQGPGPKMAKTVLARRVKGEESLFPRLRHPA